MTDEIERSGAFPAMRNPLSYNHEIKEFTLQLTLAETEVLMMSQEDFMRIFFTKDRREFIIKTIIEERMGRGR